MYDRRDYFPVGVGLQVTPFGGRARILVVDENHTMTDEDFVFQADAFADKTVTGDFTVASDARALLNLHKRPDRRSVADLTAVEIYEMMNCDIAPELNVRRDYRELTGHESESLAENTI